MSEKWSIKKDLSTPEDWGAEKDIEPFMGKTKSENIILTQTEMLSLDTGQTRRNLNVMVMGSSDSGKTCSFVLPNIMQANTSFVVNDVYNDLYGQTANFLEKSGYEVSQLNAADYEEGCFDFAKLGDKRTALFIKSNVDDEGERAKVTGLYYEIISILFQKADSVDSRKLHNHIQFFFDDFAAIGAIKDFAKLLTSMRSRNISAKIVTQNLAQLKFIYPNSWEAIVGNCDSLLFMGGLENSTLMHVLKRIESTNKRFEIVEDEKKKAWGIMGETAGEETDVYYKISRMPKEKCVLLIRGVNPFYSDKYKDV